MNQMSGSVDSTLRLLDLADESRFPLMSHVWRLDKRDESRERRGPEVWIGMPWQLLVYSIDTPNDLNSTTTAFGNRQQWVYGDAFEGASHVYLDDGKSPLIKRRESVEHAREV
jgi:hypothetical protein